MPLSRPHSAVAWLTTVLAWLTACTSSPEAELSFEPVAGEQSCIALAGRSIGDIVRIAQAYVVPPTSRHPEFCKATAEFEGSTLRFAVWLPTVGWNGKLAFIGGGGFDGVLMDEDFQLVFSDSVVTQRYAIVATNGGYDHPRSVNPAAYFQARFAADPEKRADFMYRSEHRALQPATALIARFYGRTPSHRYFEGCSMGGHDAMIQSQRYPDDFDGIVARAPAGNVVGLMRAFQRIGAYIQNNDIEFSDADRGTVADAVLTHCDARDGLTDGIIARPQNCDFEPRDLFCSDEKEGCLSAEQVELIELVTSPIIDADGRLIHPGYWFGGEDQEKGWGEYIFPKMMGQSVGMLFSQGFFRSFVTGDPEFNVWQWDPAEWRDELESIEAEFNAFDPKLQAFHDAGAKLILWTGTLDTSVSPADTVRYYENVVAELGPETASETVELILAPGVAHCFGGTGPDRIDLMDALSIWVEEGIPPSDQRLVHTKQDEAGKVVRSMPACTYPAFPRYRGEGDPTEAGSYACVISEHGSAIGDSDAAH